MANKKAYDEYTWFRVSYETFRKIGFTYADDRWTEPNGEIVVAHHWSLDVTELIEIKISYAYKDDMEYYQYASLIIKDSTTYAETHIDLNTKRLLNIVALKEMLKLSTPKFYTE